MTPEHLITTSGCDAMIHIYDLETLQTKRNCSIKNSSSSSMDGVTCLSNFNSHSFIFGCKNDKSIRIFNLEQLHSQPITFTLPQVHKNYIRSIQCLPLLNEDKKLILSAGDDKQIKISKFDTDGYFGFFVSQFPKKHSHGITCLANCNHSVLYSAGYDGQIMAWDISSQQYLQSLPLLHKDWIRYLLPLNHNTLFSCGDEPCINVFDLVSNKQITSLQEHSSYIYQIQVLHHPHLLISCSEDKSLKIWDTRKWKCVTTVKTSKEVYSLQLYKSFHEGEQEFLKVYTLTESGNVNVYQYQSGIDALEKVTKHDLIPLHSFDAEQITQHDRWCRNLLLV